MDMLKLKICWEEYLIGSTRAIPFMMQMEMRLKKYMAITRLGENG
jgi:hypothetical protein